MSDDPHENASNAVLDALQQQLDVGNIPDGGIINRFMCVVETASMDGGSKLYILHNDGRTVSLMGLTTTAQAMIISNMGNPQAFGDM